MEMSEQELFAKAIAFAAEKHQGQKRKDGEIVLSNASEKAIRKAQSAFVGVADVIGVSSDEDIQELVDEMRKGDTY